MNYKTILSILIIFISYFIFYSISYSHSISNDLQNQIFRLHIIANSNSFEDQKLKIKVRDKIVDYLQSYSFNNKDDLINYVTTHQETINNIVQKTISENGFSYRSTIEIGNSFYPKKNYNNITLPSGNYDGLKIKIGNASGKNWWCILFPPMCLINESTCELSGESENILYNNLNRESSSVIFSNSPNYKFKFKIIDFINRLN